MGSIEFMLDVVLGIRQSSDIYNFETHSLRSRQPGACASQNPFLGCGRSDVHKRALALQEAVDREAGLVCHGGPICLSPMCMPRRHYAVRPKT